MVAASELNIIESSSATAMANEIFGDGVTVVGASYSGWSNSSGIYTGGDSTSPGVVPGDTGIILSTGRAADFTNSTGSSNQSTNTSTNTPGATNDSDFNALAGASTYDASFMVVDFIPTGDTVTMQFVFSSEEYPEYSNSIYNDAVGVWINGANVELAVGDGGSDVGNVNQSDNENLFINNSNDDYNTEMDGFTVTMTLTIPVNPGVVNSIKIGIADVGDSSYDSNLLIAGDSLQTTLIANDDAVTMKEGTTKTVDVMANDDNTTGGTLTVTHINGVAVSVGDTVTLGTGQEITLNADGTFEIETGNDNDTARFTYEIESSTGATDVGFVTVETIPCFVSGTMIMTPDGEVPVESLTPGDMVMTHDDGAQPVRWIGSRTVEAVGNFAPIKIRRDTFGGHNTLMLSPQHRILIRDALAELLFGDTEVLVSAKDLVNGKSVKRMEGGDITYVHLLFDKHQVVFSEGLATESFLPGPQTTKAFEQDIVDEIVAIFPELDALTGKGYSPSARRTLKRFEAEVLLASGRAA